MDLSGKDSLRDFEDNMFAFPSDWLDYYTAEELEVTDEDYQLLRDEMDAFVQRAEAMGSHIMTVEETNKALGIKNWNRKKTNEHSAGSSGERHGRHGDDFEHFPG